MENENLENWKQHSLGIWVSSKGRLITKNKGLHYGHTNHNTGYKQVRWKEKMYLVHRLIAECFLDNPNNLPTVDHIDRNPSNNSVENLRWADHSTQNLNREVDFKAKVAHTDYKAKVANTDYKAIAKKLSIPILQFSKQGEFIKEWESACQAQRELGYDKGNITKCCKGKIKSSNGFVWRYAS